jgi:ABC-type dipeptide/oligopeptide/nickel transport system permease component
MLNKKTIILVVLLLLITTVSANVHVDAIGNSSIDSETTNRLTEKYELDQPSVQDKFPILTHFDLGVSVDQKQIIDLARLAWFPVPFLLWQFVTAFLL